MPLPIMTLEGRLTDEPELRFTPAGHAVCAFRIASSDRRKNPDTDQWEDAGTMFIRVTCWRQLAENCAESLAKGDLVLVVGKLEQREFETKQGERRTVYEITASQVGAALQFRTIKHGQAKAKAEADPGSEPVADTGAPF